jgi:hypothetical protein
MTATNTQPNETPVGDVQDQGNQSPEGIPRELVLAITSKRLSPPYVEIGIAYDEELQGWRGTLTSDAETLTAEIKYARICVDGREQACFRAKVTGSTGECLTSGFITICTITPLLWVAKASSGTFRGYPCGDIDLTVLE